MSINVYSSTGSSSFDEEAAQGTELGPCKEIGKGQCGTIWSLTGTTEAIKTANPGKTDQLYNDFLNHCKARAALENALQDIKIEFKIPRIGVWCTPANAQSWSPYIRHFFKHFQPTDSFTSERIPSVSLATREALFDAFAPKSMIKDKQRVLAQSENEDCLIRLYLGRRGVERKGFCLRNFPLMVDDMERSRLDTTKYARTMACALAMLHWVVRIDGNDIEFVLGGTTEQDLLPNIAIPGAANPMTTNLLNKHLGSLLRPLRVWPLDFDQCQHFEESTAGLKQLVNGFYFNDPYYPRPSSKNAGDVQCWEAFQAEYLDVSRKLTTSEMPLRFIQAVKERGVQRPALDTLFA